MESIIGNCGAEATREWKPGTDGLLEVMGPEGDLKSVWDPDNADETEAAKAQFDSLRAKGYLAFKVEGADGTKGEQITEWNPKAGRIILSPPMAGG